MTKRKMRTPMISLWARNEKKREVTRALVVKTFQEAIKKTSNALAKGEIDGARINMIESCNISASVVRATTAMNLFLREKSEDIKILQLLKETGFSMDTYISHGICTAQDLLEAKPGTLKKIIRHFKSSNMKIPLLVRIMTHEVLANKLQKARL